MATTANATGATDVAAALGAAGTISAVGATDATGSADSAGTTRAVATTADSAGATSAAGGTGVAATTADPTGATDAAGANGATGANGAAGTPARRRLLADLTPLRTSAHYRRLWAGNTVSSLGQQMTALAVSLQVYAITGSTFSVGLVGLCSLVPLVVFGLYGGSIADTVDRRRLGLVSATGATLLSVALAVAAFARFHQVWLLYSVVALQAVCFAMNSPARTAMIPRLLPAEQLPAANALSSLTNTVGQMAGPMLGGVIVGWWGYQAAYLVDVVAFTASLYAMWRLPSMRPDRGAGAGRPRRASVVDGLRFLGTRPNVRMTFFADLAAMVLAQPRALFPAVAALWFGGDARTVGLLVAAPAVGAILGGLFSGWLSRIRRHGLAILLSVASWGAAIALFGLTRYLWLGLFFLAVAGCADTISMVFRSTMLQAATPDEMRGRLQGVFIVVVAGGPRLGDFLAGSAADLTSAGVTVVAGGVACVVVLGLLALRWPDFARYDARDPRP
ncbi:MULTISPECIES: MFS transporter [Streptomycetaceae]|uniref:Major facilitator MFS1 protein n=1 Tax=Streptantibioticus cattleyicolor (strain ATCC 35852 / DSM 46488 / JCM 4925 / NBRC 14057 / NRRL 8057) TaxID=1003195 RepID=F8JYR5_STREN|nr:MULTISPECIES: MFS transporter [Streptomycetaceae]AEW93880.1 major facilitator MFS1 protein [Streptantibioticus cattleyicolor NRRL 8057 = DSM 46488]MYS58562.1 MFS transporter [Streptomyces sp. SID5468]CCB74228.1 Major facilitator MFS1 protein [Streptantibioticus cattleyicolor NRRL 8057 = DSM 46488]